MNKIQYMSENNYKVGDRVQVEVSPDMKYFVEIRSIEKGEDDASMEISSY